MARTAFLGTPDFALRALEALAARTELVAVVAQPDKPAGRGQAVKPPPTAAWAKAHGVQVFQPTKARDPDFLAQMAALHLDLAVVAAYGKILIKALLETPRLGCVNVHASILPRYRGAAPIQWAIARGEAETGITLMQMDEGLDTGDILAVARTPIGPDETGGALTERLAVLGGELLGAQLPAILAGTLPRVPQDHALATLAPKLTRADALLDLSKPARELHDRVRAFQPWPGALLKLPSGVLKILRTEVAPLTGPEGTVLEAGAHGLTLGTSNQALRILEVQPEGRRRMTCAEFLAGHPLAAGLRVG